MKCYTGGSRVPFEHDYVAACFANNRSEAKRLMWNHSDLPDECDHEWHDARVIRRPEHDKFLDVSKSEPYIIQDSATLRKMRWYVDGDDTCIHCGLAEMDGEFPVCPECDSCPDCGHDDECPEVLIS